MVLRPYSKLISQAIIAVLLLAGFGFARAAFNPQINYQGKLTDIGYMAVEDGNYNMRFKLCTASDCAGGSDPLWTETRTMADRVPFRSGLFSVLLGEVTSLTGVDFNQTLYLEVSVGGTADVPDWETLTPRKKLGAVPAAFEAQELGGYTWSVPGSIGLTTPNAGAFTTLSSAYSGLATAFTVNQSGTGWLADVQKSGSSKFMIDDSGNVGIGTTAPGYVLDINGGFRAGNATSTAGLVFDPATGNVGIGTTAPGAELSVNEASDPRIIVAGNEDNSSAGINLFEDYTSNPGDYGFQILYQGSGNRLEFGSFDNSTTAVPRMVINRSDGNVGIGTTAPDGNLHVYAASGASNIIVDGTGYAMFKMNSSGSERWAMFNGDSDDLFFREDGSSIRMVIQEGGNVGIGTTAPGYKLEVNGTFAAGASTFAGDILPLADNTYSLGSASYRWKDLYLGPSSLKIYNTTGADADYMTMGYSSNVATLDVTRDGSGTYRPFAINQNGDELFRLTGGNTLVLGAGDGSMPLDFTLRGPAAGDESTTGANMYFDASNGTDDGGSGKLIFRTASVGSAPSSGVSIDSISSGTSSRGSDITWSHTVASLSNRILVVGVSVYGTTVSSVTYGGVSLTQLATKTQSSSIAQLWYLKAPTAGTANVVVTLANSLGYSVGGAVSYYNVDQTNTWGTAATAGATSATPSVAVTSATGELVVDAMCGASSWGYSVGAGQTQRWNNTLMMMGGGGSTEPGASSVTMSWSSGLSAAWAIVAAPLKPAAAFQPVPNTLAARLTIDKDGNVGIGTTAPGSLLDLQSGATTGTAQGITANSLTSGVGIGVTSSATAMTGSLASITLSGSNASNTGNLLYLNSSRTASVAKALYISMASTGAYSSGGVNFTFSGAHTGTGFVVSDVTTTGTVMSLTDNALTSGTGLAVSSSSTAMTGVLGNFTLSGSGAGNTGTVLKATFSGATGTTVPLMATNAGTGLSFRVNDDGTDTDTSAFVIDASGNVGIGTTSPSYILDATSGTTDNVARFASSDDLAQVLISDNDTIGYLGAKDSTGFFGLTSGISSNNLNIGSSGNVGIGSTNTGYAKLYAEEDSGIAIFGNSGDSYGGYFVGYHSPAAGFFSQYANNNDIQDVIELYRDSDSVSGANGQGGTIGFAIQDTNNDKEVHARIGALLTDATNGSEDSALVFFTRKDYGTITERMRIDASGNVGVGTTAPTTNLDVNGAARVYSGTGGAYMVVSGTGDTYNFSALKLASDEATDKYWQLQHRSYTGEVNNFSIEEFDGSNYNQRLVIKPGGNIGIGTTAPERPLHVSGEGDSRIMVDSYGDTGSSVPGILTRGSRGTQSSPSASQSGDSLGLFSARGYGATGFSSGSRAQITFAAAENWTDSAQGTYINFLTTPTSSVSATERMRITADGNVGIGTTVPASNAKLTLNQSGAANIVARLENANGGTMFQLSDTVDYATYIGLDPTAHEMWFGADTTNKDDFTITSAGNVGIGTTAAAYTLDVGGGGSGNNVRGYDIYSHDGGMNSFSDLRLKEIEGSYTRGLNEIVRLEPVYYNYKIDNPLNLDSTAKNISLVAQEVQEAIPEAVEVGQDGYLTLNTNPLFYAMINAIKEQQSQIDDLRFQLTEKGLIAATSTTELAVDQESGFFAAVKKVLAKLGLAIKDGVASLQRVVVETFSAKTARVEQLEMVDKATGEIYCTWIEDGVWNKAEGACDEADVPAAIDGVESGSPEPAAGETNSDAPDVPEGGSIPDEGAGTGAGTEEQAVPEVAGEPVAGEITETPPTDATNGANETATAAVDGFAVEPADLEESSFDDISAGEAEGDSVISDGDSLSGGGDNAASDQGISSTAGE